MEKCQKMLLLFYNGLIPNQTMSDYIIEKVFLYEWFDEDMEVILEDYKRITEKSNKVKPMNFLNLMVTIYLHVPKELGKGEIFECSLSVMS